MAYTKSWSESVVYRRKAAIGSTTVTAAPVATYSSTRSGEAVPEWRKKIASGSDATSPYSIDAIRAIRRVPIAASASGQTASRFVITSSFDGFYQAPSTVAHLSPDTTAARNEALGKAYARLAETQTQMQGLTFLGELGETIRQMRRPFKGIVSYANAHLNRWGGRYKHAVYTKDSRAIDIASDSWLEFSFGIKPLIADAEAAAQALARYKEDIHFERTRLSASGFRVAQSASKTTSVYSNSHIVGNDVAGKVTRVDVRYIIAAAYAAEVIADSDRFLDLFGVRPDMILPAAYELIPWSWLADYFTNTGSILNAYCQSQAAVRYVVRTERTHTLVTYTYAPDVDLTIARLKAFGAVDQFKYSGSNGTVVLERTTLVRAKEPKLSIPSFQWKNPFGDFRRDANMAAVLMQRRSTYPSAHPGGSIF